MPVRRACESISIVPLMRATSRRWRHGAICAKTLPIHVNLQHVLLNLICQKYLYETHLERSQLGVNQLWALFPLETDRLFVEPKMAV